MNTMMSNATGIAGDAPVRQAIERAILEAQLVDGSGHEPVLSREANLCRIATTLEPDEAGRRLAAMVLTCYTPDERAEFDLQAIVLRAAFALADEARGTLFQQAVDLVVAEKGEPPVPWPAAMIVEAEEEPVATPTSGRRHRRHDPEAHAPHRPPARRSDHGELLPWQQQLMAARERFPDLVPTSPDGGDVPVALEAPASLTAAPVCSLALPALTDVVDVDRGDDGETAPEGAAGAPSPPSLDALRARRERILAADHARHETAAAGLAEHAALVEESRAAGAELAALRVERTAWEAEVAATFSDEARAELASLVAELRRLESARAAALAAIDTRRRGIEARPDVAGLLNRQREEAAARRRAETLAAIQAEFNAGRNATARMLATRASADDPGDAEIAAILECITRREQANRRAAVVEALPRARRFLRRGDAAGALALVERLDLAGVEPELERQATGLRFAAAEAAAVSRGLDDVRFLRLGAGRVLLAREPGGDGAPDYRVMAAAGPVGDRMVGAIADPADVRRSEPRRARK